MIYPSIDKLTNQVGSKYLLINVVTYYILLYFTMWWDYDVEHSPKS